MITLQEYTKLKMEVDRLQEASARAAGILEHETESLYKEFSVSSLEEAELLLKTTEEAFNTADRLADEKLTLFNEKWKGKL